MDALDKVEREFENVITEESKRISKFIVRGIKNGNWHTLAIVKSYTIQEARIKASMTYKEPLIVVDLALWIRSNEITKRNIEEIVFASYKKKNEEAKGD